MSRPDEISTSDGGIARGMIRSEATNPTSHRGYEAMARRRFQKPTPFKEGHFWWLLIWDSSRDGQPKTSTHQTRTADMATREVQKIAEEKLRPVNQGLALTGSAMKFNEFLNDSTNRLTCHCFQEHARLYQGPISKYLEPRFGGIALRDLSRQTLQQYFSGMAAQVSYPTISKIRDVLSSILRSAVDVEFLNKNTMEGLRLPLDKRPRRPKPTITPEQFNNLMQLVPEPYATMIFVAVWTGLRVSEDRSQMAMYSR